jgi:hypothetical protein
LKPVFDIYRYQIGPGQQGNEVESGKYHVRTVVVFLFFTITAQTFYNQSFSASAGVSN